MDKKDGGESIDDTKTKRHISAINLNYLWVLRELCDMYGKQLEEISGYPYYYEQVFKLELAKQQKLEPDSKEHDFAMQSFIKETNLMELKKETESVSGEIPFERLCLEHNLAKSERMILATLYFMRFDDKDINGLDLLKLAGLIDGCEPLQKIQLISSSGTLLKAELIEQHNKRFYTVKKKLPFELDYRITKTAFKRIAGITDNCEPARDSDESEEAMPTSMFVKDPDVSFENLILPQDIKNNIEDALWQFQNGAQIYEKYGLSKKIPYGRAVAMLFYGPPGTGKTATSVAIAKKLDKKIAFVSYDKVYSMWVGGSQKNLVRIFNEAKENNYVLLFDEAESLFAQRIEESRSVDRMHNTMTNLLMQELERTTNLVVLTTNREVVMDKAFERRLLLKLKFDLPPARERAKIWEVFLKDCPHLSPDISFEELGDYELAGGKIKNIIIKTVMKCAKEERLITHADLHEFAKQETKSDLGKEKNIGFKN